MAFRSTGNDRVAEELSKVGTQLERECILLNELERDITALVVGSAEEASDNMVRAALAVAGKE